MNRFSKVKELALSRDHSWVKDALLIMFFAFLTAIGAIIEIRLPFTPVPVTLQTFFVFLAGATLGWKRGALSQLTYLVSGIAGLPVFSGGAAGLMWLFSATGGYLLAFPAAAAIAGLLSHPSFSFARNTTVLLFAAMVVLAGGFCGLVLFVPDAETAFQFGVVPFIAGDLLKAAAAAGVISGIRRILR